MTRITVAKGDGIGPKWGRKEAGLVHNGEEKEAGLVHNGEGKEAGLVHNRQGRRRDWSIMGKKGDGIGL